MTPEQTYMFDLQGFVVLRNVVPPAAIANANAALDRFEELAPPVGSGAVANDSTSAGDLPHPCVLGDERTDSNLYISNILEGDLAAFTPFMDIPQVLGVIQDTAGGPWRLNHTYSICRWGGGQTSLHGAGTPVSLKTSFRYDNGRIYSALTKAVFPLLDSDEDSGCFACIPGSHKSNFVTPFTGAPEEHPGLVSVPANAGDAIVFCEAVTHGSTMNVSGMPRRTLYYAYSVGFMPDWGGQSLAFSADLESRLTPAQAEIVRLK